MTFSSVPAIPALSESTFLWEITADSANAFHAPAGVREVVLSLRGSRGIWLSQEVESARRALDEAIAACDRAGVRVLIKPDAWGFPSDVPSTIGFLRSRESVGLCVEPAALFTQGMIEDCAVHLERFAHGFLSLPALSMVLLSDVRFEGEERLRTEIGDGLLGGPALAAWAALARETPVFRVSRCMP